MDKTLGYFERHRPDGIERVALLTPKAPTRLPPVGHGWHKSEGEFSWSTFAKMVTESSETAAFFLDSSFLGRREIPQEVLTGLLSRKIVVAPQIWGEMKDWIENPFANSHFRDAIFNASKSSIPAIAFLRIEDWGEDVTKSVKYYISLLLARKLIGHAIRSSSKQTKGEEITDEALLSQIQKFVGEHGSILAKKGLEDHEKPNFSADEELVVSAVTYAILSGNQTFVLTRDRDPLEQFRKFMFILDTHYRCNRIAESFVQHPENLIKHEGFVEETAAGMLKPGIKCVIDYPRRFTEWVLPSNSDSVSVNCIRLAGDGERMRAARLSFNAHREMTAVLKVKGRTGGRNFELPNDLNCHLAVSPPFTESIGGKVILAQDQIAEFGPFKGPRLDLEYTVQEVQRFRRTIIDPTATSSGFAEGLQLADFCIIDRLTYSAPPEWRAVPWFELGKAVQYLDAAAFFFIDEGVISSLHADVRGPLFERGFRWSTKIRDAALFAQDSTLTPGERTEACKRFAFDVSKVGPSNLGFGYYLALLSLRKQFGKIIRARVRKEYKRDCQLDEVREIAKYYSGNAGLRLIEGEATRAETGHYYAGDELLVHGMFDAIFHGADVVFLSRDYVFMDQFLTLCQLLSKDYIACEFGRRYAAEPQHFQTRALRTPPSDPFGLSIGDAEVCSLRDGWKSTILPHNPFLVNLHCWLFGMGDAESVQLATFTFCAERPMHNLLRIKGATSGRNYEESEGKNIHVGFPGPTDQEGVAMIWKDRMVRHGATDFPVDARLSLGISELPAITIGQLFNSRDDVKFPWDK